MAEPLVRERAFDLRAISTPANQRASLIQRRQALLLPLTVLRVRANDTETTHYTFSIARFIIAVPSLRSKMGKRKQNSHGYRRKSDKGQLNPYLRAQVMKKSQVNTGDASDTLTDDEALPMPK